MTDFAAELRKLRPKKIKNAVRRRWFEYRVPNVELRDFPQSLVYLGSSYGGWVVPAEAIEPSWVCYTVGAGGDITFDLELAGRRGATVRAFEPVADYVDRARADGDGHARFSVHQAAIADKDGPIRMQATHDRASQSVSSAGLYETAGFVEMPGRSLPSLMAELGDQKIDLLKLDIEGGEYDLLPTLDLNALGVKVFAVQLHHTGSVREARELIGHLADEGYDPVACWPAVKFTFVHRSWAEARASSNSSLTDVQPEA